MFHDNYNVINYDVENREYRRFFRRHYFVSRQQGDFVSQPGLPDYTFNFQQKVKLSENLCTGTHRVTPNFDDIDSILNVFNFIFFRPKIHSVYLTPSEKNGFRSDLKIYH